MRGARTEYDVIIAGGGPAGLSAALWLARYRRSVRVFDAGPARNQPAWAVHGYPGIADPTPSELREILRAQATAAGAQVGHGEVVTVSGAKGAFDVGTTAGGTVSSARVILAYGLRDYIPAIPGIEALYGTAVFHCPDCDGPSVTGARVGVLGWDRGGAALALYLLTWTDRVTLLAHGCPLDLEPHAFEALERNGISIRTEVVSRVIGSARGLEAAELEGAGSLELDALFFHLGSEPRCALAHDLSCETDAEGYIAVDRGQETSVRGIHAAGDITGPPHLVSVAAAEGVRAALAVHRSLLPESRHI